MIEGKYLYGADDNLSEVLEIRRAVYMDEKLLSEKFVFDGYDQMCIHGLLSVAGKNVGSGRLMFDGDEYRISYIAILKEERKKGYGDFLVRMLIDKAFLSGAEEVVAAVTPNVKGFYNKIGFISFSENYIDLSGIEWIDMKVSKTTLCKECQKK